MSLGRCFHVVNRMRACVHIVAAPMYPGSGMQPSGVSGGYGPGNLTHSDWASSGRGRSFGKDRRMPDPKDAGTTPGPGQYGPSHAESNFV